MGPYVPFTWGEKSMDGLTSVFFFCTLHLKFSKNLLKESLNQVFSYYPTRWKWNEKSKKHFILSYILFTDLNITGRSDSVETTDIEVNRSMSEERVNWEWKRSLGQELRLNETSKGSNGNNLYEKG